MRKNLSTHHSLLITLHCHGTAVAHRFRMARRVTALFTLFILLSLVFVLVWRVYEHHESATGIDERAFAIVDARAA